MIKSVLIAVLLLSTAPCIMADTGLGVSPAGTLTATAPATPVLKSPAHGATAVTLPAVVQWDSLDHAASYTLQVSTAEDFSSTLMNQSGLTDTSYSVTGLDQGITYYWQVRATNPAGDGSYSTYRDFITESSLPVELSSFSAESVPGGVLVKWTTESETDNQGFILERSSSPATVETHCNTSALWDRIATYLTHNNLRGQGSISQRTEYTFTDQSVQPGHTYTYRLSDVSTDGEIHIYDDISIILEDAPDQTVLAPPFPNPFNPETKIGYTIAKSSPVEITVYDLLGRKVKTLIDQQQATGSYNIYWHGRDEAGMQAATGSYLIVLKTVEGVKTQKVVMVR
ncbi:T9SS type A sorting domain-containing protein [bacterium]|nr:T9SS type A sorting domain-containing protein [bacterium]